MTIVTVRLELDLEPGDEVGDVLHGILTTNQAEHRPGSALHDWRIVAGEQEGDEDEPDDPRVRDALGYPNAPDDTPSLDTSFHDHEMDI